MMYRRILLSFLTMLFLGVINSNEMYAQGVKVNNAIMEINGASSPALSATFELVDQKDLTKSWKSFIKKEEKIKFGTKKGMLVHSGAGPNNISEKIHDAYSKVVSNKDKVELLFAISIGYSNFVDATTFPVEYQKMRSAFQKFATEYSTDFYTSLLREKDRENDKAQKELDKTMSKFSGNKEKIESNEKDVKKMRDKIEDLQKDNRSLSESNVDLTKDIGEFQKKAEEKKIELEIVKSKMKELGINP